MSQLLEPGFIRELEALRRRLDIRARSGAMGEHAARRRGGSAEFQDHRPYSPGDDLRRIDWAAFARSGEPVVKLFRTEEDAIGRLALDTSKSLDFGTPTKFAVGQRIAAAIGYMMLAASQRAQVFAMDETLHTAGKPSRGRGAFAGLARSLSLLRCEGATNLATSIDAIVRRSAKPGWLVVLSDFFDPGAVIGALQRAKAAGHDLALVQVLAAEELNPPYEGDWTLEDAETGATVNVTMDPRAVRAYVLRLTGLCEELRGFCRRHDAVYVRATTDEALEPVVRRFVARAID